MTLEFAVLDSVGEGALLVDQDGRVYDANRTALALLGYSAEELLGSELAVVLEGGLGGSPEPASVAHRRPDGDDDWFSAVALPWGNACGDESRRLVRFGPGARPESGKDARLLRESRHRMKNDLNAVAAILAEAAGNPERRIEAALRRVRAVAAFYALVDEEAEERDTALAPYLRVLAQAYGPPLSLELDLQDLRVSHRVALATALAAAELTANAAEHAYAFGPGRVRLRLSGAAGRGLLEVGDDGPGMDRSALEAHASGEGGLGLALGLLADAGAALDFRSGPGATALVDFPLAAARDPLAFSI